MLQHDLALLVLPERVEFGRTTNYPARPMTPVFDVNADGVRGRLAGYGPLTHPPLASGPIIFRQAAVETFDFSDDWWKDDLTGTSGDSGGPVERGDPDREDLEILGALFGSTIDFERGDPGDGFFISVGPKFSDRANREWLQPRLARMETITSPAAPGDSYEVWTGPVDVPPIGEFRTIDDWVVDPDGDGLGLVDPDGDGAPEQHDNCPLIFNPEQRDNEMGRGDGVGDATLVTMRSDGSSCTDTCESAEDVDRDRVLDSCDNCVGIRNADQADCDNDGVGDACLCWVDGTPAACEPDADRDRIPDDCDPCALGASTRNTNVDGEIQDSVDSLLGPCDPNPSATGAWAPPPVPPTEVSNNTLSGEGLITTGMPGSTLEAQMVTGFRFCPCNFAVWRSGTVPLRCQTPLSVGGPGCEIDHTQFAAGGGPTTAWRTMALRFTEPTATSGSQIVADYSLPDPFGRDGPASYVATWNFVIDAADVLRRVGGGVQVRGVFWTSARSYSDCSGGICPPVPNGNLNSHYFSDIVERLDPAFLRVASAGLRPITPMPSFFGADPICPTCADQFPVPVLTVDQPECPTPPCPESRPLVRLGAFDVDVSANVSPIAAGLLADESLRWLAPSEPREYLDPDTFALVGVDAASLDLVEVLVSDHGRLRTPRDLQPIDPPGTFPLFRASRDEYLVLGGAPQAAIPIIHLQTLETRWTVLEGALPEHVVAAAVDAVHARLLLIDIVPAARGRGDEIRLLLVDLESGASRELMRQRRGSGFDDFWLASAPGPGQFVLGSSNRTALRHRLLTLSVGAEGSVTVTGVRPGRGHIVGQMITDRRGVSLIVEQRGATTWQLAGHRWSDFLPASGRELSRAL